MPAKIQPSVLTRPLHLQSCRRAPPSAVSVAAKTIGVRCWGMMVAIWLAFAPPARCEEPTQPFAASLGTQVHIVTDDDFLQTSSTAWCQRSIERAISKCKAVRAGSEIQSIYQFAGAPGILNKDRPKAGPRRAICLICDSQGRVFSFCIGVPSGDQLLVLLEDAEELILADSLAPADQATDDESDDEQTLTKNIRQRTAGRTIRHYRPLLDKVREDSTIQASAQWLAPAVQQDLAERFLLSLPIDGARLVSTQQHMESSRYWCDAMLPCVAGKSMQSVWPELAEVVWNAKPWHLQVDPTSLASWYESAIRGSMVVLELDLQLANPPNSLPYLSAAENNPPRPQVVSDKAAERMRAADAELAKRLLDVAHRVIELPELASLLTHRKDPPIDILLAASTPRWIVFENASDKPTILPPQAQERLVALLDRWVANRP